MSSSYCIWGLCDSQEYCCGDNVCCKETDINSVFLTAIIFGILVIMALCFTYLYCNSQRVYASFFKKYFKISYNLMSTQQEKKVGCAVNQESMKEDYVVQIEKTKTLL